MIIYLHVVCGIVHFWRQWAVLFSNIQYSYTTQDEPPPMSLLSSSELHGLTWHPGRWTRSWLRQEWANCDVFPTSINSTRDKETRCGIFSRSLSNFFNISAGWKSPHPRIPFLYRFLWILAKTADMDFLFRKKMMMISQKFNDSWVSFEYFGPLSVNVTPLVQIAFFPEAVLVLGAVFRLERHLVLFCPQG